MCEDTKEIPDAAEPLIEAAENQIESSLKTVEKRVNAPVEKAAEASVQLLTGAQLKDVVSRHFTELGKIAWSDAKALGVGALSLIPVLGGAGEVATQVEPLWKVIGKRGADKVGKVLKELNPLPDVPSGVTVAAGAAETLGLEGAGAIPAGIQLIINEFKLIRQSFRTAKEIGSVLINSPEAQKMKDFTTSTIGTIKGRLEKADTPRMAAAAEVFSNKK